MPIGKLGVSEGVTCGVAVDVAVAEGGAAVALTTVVGTSDGVDVRFGDAGTEIDTQPWMIASVASAATRCKGRFMDTIVCRIAPEQPEK